MKNKVSLMLDTSGAGLHKRGYRQNANDAPIKETLAASLCWFSRLRPYHSLYDPMCGSGTILIEGAMMARNIAPGVNRNFAAERWSNIPRDVWYTERERARDLEREAHDFFAYGSDISREAAALTAANAEAAGVDDLVSVRCCELKNSFRRPSAELLYATRPMVSVCSISSRRTRFIAIWAACLSVATAGHTAS